MELFKELSGFRMSSVREDMIHVLGSAFNENLPETKVFEYLRRGVSPEPMGRLVVIGFGKASQGMYEGVKRFFGNRISNSAIIAPVEAYRDFEPPLLPGNHPLPSRESIESSRIVMDLLTGLKEEDLVIVLISGGGSSLFEVLKDGVDLSSYNRVIECMMRNGASISEVNAIRYLFSEVKGGGLLRYTYPANVLGLVISDVPGDSIWTIASGPTSNPPDQSFVEKVSMKFGGLCSIPLPQYPIEYPKSRSRNEIVLRNSDFVSSICRGLVKKGYRVHDVGSGIVGYTSTVAKLFVDKMREDYNENRSPIFVVGGGESSTEVKGNGTGGRNLETSMKVLLLMEDEEIFAFGSIGTDGIDGSSKAMGAIVDNSSLKILKREYIRESLSRSESLKPLKESRDALFTGFTGTNVADIFIGYYAGIGKGAQITDPY
ncbi:MAG: DUF4147 domain-containing protein [Candidatus Thermoplasmatota archaeon]|nr:DUF4147 domain-containing protein [Candidatus Thermoplasmatota archaeon]MCL5789639.1 DUF4147 domain-containing protein [Candidatus Thermoplasmatota archaeon]